jgi:hypothetical protein
VKIKALRKELKRIEKQYGDIDVLVEGTLNKPQPMDGVEVYYEWLAAKPKVVIW